MEHAREWSEIELVKILVRAASARLHLAPAVSVFAILAVTVLASRSTHASSIWYVSTGGNDSHDCLSPTTSCATLQSAIDKAQSGDTVLVSIGIFKDGGTEFNVATISKSVTLSGGWSETFTDQDGFSIIDGQGARRGVFVDYNGNAVIERFVIQNGYSGGVYSPSGAGVATAWGNLTLSDSTIRNSRSVFHGGGMDICGGVTNLNNVAIVGNSARMDGGGIVLCGGDAVVNLSNCTVSNNEAENGGGISSAGHAVINLRNCTISDNKARNSGGGLSAEQQASPYDAQNTILAGNTAGTGPDCAGIIASSGYNLVSDSSGCNFGATTGDLLNVDPGLVPLAAWLGFCPLQPDSPAVDAGNPTGCTDSSGSPLSTDQRGATRAGHCDIGAYEYALPGPPASVHAYAGTPQSTLVSTNFQSSLQTFVLDGIGTPVSNTIVAFAAPSSGASGTFSGTGTLTATAITDEAGIATAPIFTANRLAGIYTVTAAVDGVATPASFSLTNVAREFLPLIACRYCAGFFDDFGDPTSGWPMGEDSYVRTEYLNGEYRVLSKQAGYLYLFRAPTCDRENYTVEMDARWQGAPGSSYGIVFGIAGDFGHYYLFDVNAGYRMFRLYRRSPSGFTQIVTLTYSAAIHGGTASNHIKATRSGSSITLEVNGTVLGTWSDGEISGLTGVGLVSGPFSGSPTSDARFDNFSVISNVGGSATAR